MNLKFKKTKIWVILLIIYGLFMIGDLVSTQLVFNHHGHQLLETNPIYLLTGSWGVLILINLVAFLLIFLVFYPKWATTPNRLFFFTSFIVYDAFLRLNVILNHILLLRQEPVPIDVASQIQTSVKIASYTKANYNLAIIPIIVIMIVYFIYKLGVRIELKEDENNAIFKKKES